MSGRLREGRRLLVASVFGLLVLALASGQALATPAESGQEPVARVELNSASVEELCTLPGVGPKKAEAIVAFRQRRSFVRVTQLMLVKGIGRKTLERLRPLVFVAPPSLKGPAPRDGRSSADP